MLKIIAETYTIRLLGMVLSFVGTIILARELGPDGRGVYAALMALCAICVQFGNLGLPGSNTYHSAKNPGFVPTLVANSILAGIAIGALLLLALLALAHVLPQTDMLTGGLLVLGALWIPCSLIYSLLQGVVLGLMKFRSVNQVELLQRTLMLMALGVLAYVGGLTVMSAFGSSLLCLIVSGAAMLMVLRPSLGRAPRPSVRLLYRGMPYGLRIYVASIFTFLVMRIDVVVVQQRLSSEDAGLLSVAVSLADALAVLPVVVGGIMFPQLAKEADVVNKWRITQRSALAVAATMGTILVVIAASAGWFIPALFGTPYAGAINLFLWLTPGIFCLALTSILSPYVASVGQPLLYPIGTAIVLLSVVAFEIALVPSYGSWLAAACISLTCFLFLCVAYVTCATYNRRQLAKC